tara:strand:- start:4 stop:579 length:576 start_codon:yes stop_codon:yes gene_type:complete
MIIKKYKTIQSSHKTHFDKLVNKHLEYGWELLDDGFCSTKSFGSDSFSQVVIWKDEKDKEIDFHENGRKSIEGLFIDGKKIGLWTEWYSSGLKMSEKYHHYGERTVDVVTWDIKGNLECKCSYNNWELHGTYTKWDCKTGNKYYESTYNDGKLDGLTIFWDEEGNITRECMYKNDKPMDSNFGLDWILRHY